MKALVNNKPVSTLAGYLKNMSEGWRALAQATGAACPLAEAYVVEHGRDYTSQAFTADELATVLGLIRNFSRFPIKQCFSNSQQVALRNTTLPGLKYVEGYCVREDVGFPFLHGWLTYNDKVIDLTLRVPPHKGRRRLRDRTLGEFSGVEYFGVPFEPKVLFRFIHETKLWGSLFCNGWSGNPLLQFQKEREAS